MSEANPSVLVVLAVTSDTAFLNLDGISILIRSFESLADIFPSHKIVVVATPKDSSTANDLLAARAANFKLVIPQSFVPAVLALCLENLLEEVQAVLIHDASRPLKNNKQFENVLTALDDETDAVRPAVAFTETLKVLDADSVIIRTLDRSSVLRISTPELIRVTSIDFAGSDSGWFLPLRKGARTVHIEGNPDSLRINTVEDLGMMELNLD